MYDFIGVHDGIEDLCSKHLYFLIEGVKFHLKVGILFL
jgi:hypothetical protein